MIYCISMHVYLLYLDFCFETCFGILAEIKYNFKKKDYFFYKFFFIAPCNILQILYPDQRLSAFSSKWNSVIKGHWRHGLTTEEARNQTNPCLWSYTNK